MKLDELRLKEEARLGRERDIDRIKAAREYYDMHLLRKYILGTFKKLIAKKRTKISLADDFHLIWIKKHGLTKLRHAI